MARVEPGDHRPVLRGLVLLMVLPFTLIAPASAGTTTRSDQTVGQCLAAEEVWLHVQTEVGEVLRSECVGRPRTGLEALRAADVAWTEAKGGYLCTLSGHPERCPTRFAGQYWQYFHAAGVGAGWTYAAKGPGERRPARGGLEGWCYNARDEHRCALPDLVATDVAADRVDRASPGRGPRQFWAVGALLLALGATAVWIRSRR